MWLFVETLALRLFHLNDEMAGPLRPRQLFVKLAVERNHTRHVRHERVAIRTSRFVQRANIVAVEHCVAFAALALKRQFSKLHRADFVLSFAH